MISSTAHAADHLMRFNEVMVSQSNSTANQFLELIDLNINGEPFTNTPYRVAIYDAAGTQIGQPVTVTVPQNMPTRILVATASFAGRDATLPGTLPANGQACFISGSNSKIACLAWGCVTLQINAIDMARAPSPPNDQSSQRQSDGTYQLAAPTADANNTAGSVAPNCPTEPDAPPMVDGPVNTGPDAGVMPDAGGNNNNPGDDGGCCQVDGSRSAPGGVLLALALAFVLRRRRR